MTRFGEISIKGFRRLADVELELRPLTVLIGANGIGKTSILDVLSLLASSAQGSLNIAISEFGGLASLYTGTTDFADAADAKRKMPCSVGPKEQLSAHAAQYEFEAWLPPYWAKIKTLSKSDVGAPTGKPESVDHDRPPWQRTRGAFEEGKNVCLESKEFLNTILELCQGDRLE